MKKITKAELKMNHCIGKRWTGNPNYLKQKKVRALTIARTIDKQFGVHIYQYKQKHIKWYIEYELSKKMQGTITNYRPVVFAIIKLLEKENSWQPLIELAFKRVLSNN